MARSTSVVIGGSAAAGWRAWLAARFELGRASPANTADQTGNVPAMEGLRGFAVFLVFLVHYVTQMTPWTPPGVVGRIATGMHTIGNAGVDLFFVLSGYLIYGSLIARRVTFRRFMARRIERIYPAFLVVLAIYLLLSTLFPERSKIPAGWSTGAIYIGQNLLLLPGLLPIEPVITVAWSLSYEMFFYILVPILVTVLALRSRSNAWRAALLVCTASIMLALAALFGGPVRLVMFLAGMLLFEAMQARVRWVPSSATALLVLVLGLSSTLVLFSGFADQAARTAALAFAFFVACLAMFAKPQAWLARSFTWTPLRWLGNMSYSYYLVHGLTLNALFMLLARWLKLFQPDALLFTGMLPVAFATTLVPSAMLFLWVERPLSLTPRRRRAADPAAATNAADSSVAARR